MARDTGLGMRMMLKSVSYHGILIDSFFSIPNHPNLIVLRELMLDGLANGVVQPLPRTEFPSDKVGGFCDFVYKLVDEMT